MNVRVSVVFNKDDGYIRTHRVHEYPDATDRELAWLGADIAAAAMRGETVTVTRIDEADHGRVPKRSKDWGRLDPMPKPMPKMRLDAA